ncbi:MAG: Lipopolysaccharide core heptosyltransferase RfaQ [Elusimicrobia bacterium]|nr:Lipopolysaccharide core heptosyltransferase RfaQ [Elusimicrobiota bacterium]
MVIKLAAVGDTLLVGRVLQIFKEAHPTTELHWLVSNINKSVAVEFPEVDNFLVWDRKILSLPALLKKIRRECFDVVVDLEQWSRGTAILCGLSGVACRLGFDTPGQHRAFVFSQTKKKTFDHHEIDDFFGILSLIAPLKISRELSIKPSQTGFSEINVLAPFIKEKKMKVLIHPGCGEDGLPREWPISQYALLAHWLIKKFNAEIILTSGPEETHKTYQLNQLINGLGKNLGGKLSWPGLIALVGQVDLVISGNTGVMHIAAALKKKQVALHGPTDPKIWGPLNSQAVVIQSNCPDCPSLKLGYEYHSLDQSCMERITLEQVKAAISGLG